MSDELTGCSCRWDRDDNRVATCQRHQGWLDVVQEWADRARAAEANPSAVPDDFHSHRESWRGALETCFKLSPLPDQDQDDRGYWRHELAAFDKAYSELKDPTPLSKEEYTELAHRMCSTYQHRQNSGTGSYTFLPHTLEHFVRAIEAGRR